MTTLVLIARLLLAGVFIVSGVAKLRDHAGSRTAVQDFGVPKALVGLVAGALPILELVCAALLVSADPAATLGAALALLMLLAFTVAIVANVQRGNRVECHCFGQIGSSSIGWSTVARNGVLLLIAVVTLSGAGGLGSVPAVLADYSAVELGGGLGVAVLVGAVLVLAVALKTLMGRYGTVLLRLEALEMVTGTAPPKPAPAFALPDLDGRVVDLDDVIAEGRPTLVAFISPSCSLCEDLLPDFEQWQRDADHPVSLLVLSSGSVGENRAKLGGREVTVLLHDGTVANDYDMQGTPAAFLLGADGLIAAPTAYGVDAVRALHHRTVQTVTGSDNTHVHQIGPRPLAPGDVLPELVVTPEGEVATTLEAITEDESVLLFWRSTCGYCAEIAHKVAELESSVRVLLVTGSTVGELTESGLSSGVLREPDGAVTSALRVPGTPAAVRIRAGVIQSEVAIGGPPVLALLRESASLRAPV